MNVIFTEIDGVLNTPLILKQKGLVSFDDLCFDRYVGLVKTTGAKIVCSSPWRLSHHKYGFFKSQLTQAGIIGELIGETPNLGVEFRHVEIKDWLKANTGVAKFAILDTFYAAEIPNEPNCFFKVNEQEGLTPMVVTKVIEYFNQVNSVP